MHVILTGKICATWKWTTLRLRGIKWMSVKSFGTLAESFPEGNEEHDQEVQAEREQHARRGARRKTSRRTRPGRRQLDIQVSKTEFENCRWRCKEGVV